MLSPPCHGCKHSARCKADSLACEAFVLFKRQGGSPERLACAPRQPSAEIFERAHAPKTKKPASAVFRGQASDDDEADFD